MLGCGVLAAVEADDLAGDRYTPKITATPSGGKNNALLEGSIYEVTANYSKYVAKKLKAKTTYWIRIRTYKVVNKEKIVSVWSKKVKVKTK